MSLAMLISDCAEFFDPYLSILGKLYVDQHHMADYEKSIFIAQDILPDLFLCHVHAENEGAARHFFEAVQSHPDLTSVPRLLLLKNHSLDKQLQWLQAGVILCLPDTISSENLLGVVQVVVQRHSQIRTDLEQQIEADEKKDVLYRQLLMLLSHDLRNLFTGMLSAAELMLELSPESPAKQPDDILRHFADSARSGAFLLEETLSYLQHTPANLMLSAERLLLSELLYKARKLLAFRSFSRKVQVIIQADDTLYVHADAVLLFSVLYNLLDNAIKFTVRGQSVTCILQRHQTVIGPICELRVQDRAPELRVAECDRVASHSAKQPGDLSRGWGAGLWLSRQLLEQMGGTFSMKSSRTEGNCLTVTLPLAEPTSETRQSGSRQWER